METSEMHDEDILSQDNNNNDNWKTVNVTYRDQSLEVSIPEDEDVSGFASRCAELTNVELEKISIFFMPKPGLLKHPFSNRKLNDFLTSKTRIKVIGTPNTEIKKMDDIAAQTKQVANARSNIRKVQPAKYRDWKKIQEESTYTFHGIEPLSYLPNPERSQRYLERLANDPGIKAAMRKHKFSVGLLTEMNPAEHTTHESKTLGLNRNKGEVIELRLRTDRYDGYRDYKVIRKTLCHELAHNVHSEHERPFYNLMAEIEADVQRNDTLHGGHRLTSDEFYDPNDTYDDAEHADHGGWTGGEFIIGRLTNAADEAGLSRREIMARAAMARQQKQQEIKKASEQEEAPK